MYNNTNHFTGFKVSNESNEFGVVFYSVGEMSNKKLLTNLIITNICSYKAVG